MFNSTMFKHIKHNLLWCFSPAVMLTTFGAEYLFALWAFLFHRHTRFGQLSILMLLLLGTFQLSEYQICVNDPSRTWAVIGMVAITFLPPLGLYLIGLIRGNLISAQSSLGIACLFLIAFLLVPQAVGEPVCGGNYVILKTAPQLANAYGIYYIGYLLWALWEGWITLKTKLPEAVRASLKWLLIGYIAFMLPTGIVYFVSEKSRDAVPSIMCGFALALAVIVIVNVLPLYHMEYPAKTKH